jgi:hypothetical protein
MRPAIMAKLYECTFYLISTGSFPLPCRIALRVIGIAAIGLETANDSICVEDQSMVEDGRTNSEKMPCARNG